MAQAQPSKHAQHPRAVTKPGAAVQPHQQANLALDLCRVEIGGPLNKLHLIRVGFNIAQKAVEDRQYKMGWMAHAPAEKEGVVFPPAALRNLGQPIPAIVRVIPDGTTFAEHHAQAPLVELNKIAATGLVVALPQVNIFNYKARVGQV